MVSCVRLCIPWELLELSPVSSFSFVVKRSFKTSLHISDDFHRALLSQVEKACGRVHVKEPSDENLTCKANSGPQNL